MELIIKIRRDIGAICANVIMARSLGTNPVSGGIPPIDSNSSITDTATTLFAISLSVRILVVLIFNVTIMVNTGIIIIEYSAKYTMVS